MDDRLTVPTDARAFLAAIAIDRQRWLQAIGLGRYEFLTRLAPTEANAVCVARFLGQPDRVKFPNLRGADLSGLDLRAVNFIRAKLHAADLSGSDLRDADLLFADLSAADLTGADLRGAALDRTVWAGSGVRGCDLRHARGLTPNQRQDLAHRGAIVS